MKLQELIENHYVSRIVGSPDVEVVDIQLDSRKCKAGTMFFAIKGTVSDGHAYIDSAIERGASVVVCETLPEEKASTATYIQCSDSSAFLNEALSVFYADPSSQLTLVGVTGTNGKTTIATLLYSLFLQLGYKAGLLSTVANYINGEKFPATHTTPGAVELFGLLAEMVEAGCEYVFMEVSSHAIDQGRIKGLQYNGAIFTNITRDHLDYHKTFDEYIRVKKSFFDHLPVSAFALVNEDDKNGMVMVQNCVAQVRTYSVKSFSDYKCKILETHFDGTLLSLNGAEVWTKFVGDFNAYNLLAVYSAAMQLGQSADEVLSAMSLLVPVAGRFEVLKSGNGIFAIVDYAHTPDALVNVLETINKLRTKNEELITVVGAGGDRDAGKRPIMGKISAELSTKVILTADNPRSEDPNLIAEQMKQGVLPIHTNRVLTIIDRQEAIRTAIMLAKPGDIVLVAGKGHEDYQVIKGVTSHFDDKEIIAQIFKTL